MSYEEKYAEYLEAERELYLAKRKKEQAEEELEERKREAQAVQMVQDVFEKEGELYQKRAETYENTVQLEQRRLSSLVPPKVNIEESELQIEKKEMILEDLDAILQLQNTDPDVFLLQENILKQALLSGGMADSYDDYIENIHHLKEEEKQQAIERLEYEFPSLEEIEQIPPDVRPYAQKQAEDTLEKETYETAFIEIPRIQESLKRVETETEQIQQEIETAKMEHYGKKLGNPKVFDQEEFETEQKRLNQSIEDLKHKKESYLWNEETFVRSRTTYTKEFSFTKLNTLDEEKQREIKEEIDRQIQQYQWTGQGEKPVHSIKEYQEFLENSNKQIEEWNLEQKRLQTTGIFLPENIHELSKIENSDVLEEGIKTSLERFQNAKEEELLHQDHLAKMERQGMPLPDTFTKLNALKKDPVSYNQTVSDINLLIQAKRDKKDLNNLEEYWGLEREYEHTDEEYSREQKKFHAQKKTLDTSELQTFAARLEELNKKKISLRKQYYEQKERIKGWIREKNTETKDKSRQTAEQQKQALASEKEALYFAKEKAKKEEAILLQKIQTYNQSQKENVKTKRKEIDQSIKEVREKQENQKRFLKDHVIRRAMDHMVSATENEIKEVEIQKKELETYWKSVKNDPEHISEPFQTKIKEKETERAALQKEYEEKKKITDSVFKKEAEKRKRNSRNMQLYKAYQEDAEQRIENRKVVIAAQKKAIENRIKTVNENNKTLNALIEEQRKQLSASFGTQYDDYVNQVIQKDEEAQFKQAKSEYRTASVKMRVMDMAASLMGKVTQTYRDQLIKVTEGLIKGEVAEKETQRNELLEKINKMSQGQSRISEAAIANPMTSRQRITLDALETERLVQTGNRIQKSQNELNTQLVQLNREIQEMKQSQEQRIQENRERIDAMFQEPSRLDADLLKRRNEIMEQISQEVEQELPSSGDQKAQHQLREEEFNQFILEDEMLQQEWKKHVEAIQQGSEALKSLLTETNLSRMDLAANIIVKVCNIAIGKINEANKDSNPVEPILLDQTLDELENTLSSDEPKAEHLLTKVFRIGTLVYDKMAQANQSIQQIKQETETDLLVSKQNYDGIIRQNEQIKQTQQTGNLLERKQNFYKNEMEQVKASLRDREEFSRTAARKAARQQDMLQADIKSKQDNIYGITDPEQIQDKSAESKSLSEILQENQRNLDVKKDSMNLAFAQTVKEHEKDPVSFAELDIEDDIVSKEFHPDQFEFLSKLTGIQMNKDMPLDMAMNAFGKIYINGMNAIDYFQLDERYKNIRFSDLQQDVPSGMTESEKLVQGLVYYGESIRQALEAQVNPEKQENLQGDAKRLYGQMIAVEDQTMRLSPLKLHSNDLEISKKVEKFNKHSDLITDQWNQMRSMAAEFEIAKQTKEKETIRKETVREKTREKINLLEEEEEPKKHLGRERLTEAIHKSRSLQR